MTRMGKCYVTRPIGDSGGVERLSEHVHRSNVTQRLLHLLRSRVSGKNQTNV